MRSRAHDRGAIGMVKVSAVVLAILGGICALLGYATIVRDKGGSDAVGYVWLLLLVTGFVGLGVLSYPQDGLRSGRACPGCARKAQDDWALCPHCGTELPHPIQGIARPGGEEAEVGQVDEDYEPEIRPLGKALFWLGILALDALFVLFVLWLFIPSLAVSQRIFSSMTWPLGIVVLDIGIGCILASYSLVPRSAIRL